MIGWKDLAVIAGAGNKMGETDCVGVSEKVENTRNHLQRAHADTRPFAEASHSMYAILDTRFTIIRLFSTRRTFLTWLRAETIIEVTTETKEQPPAAPHHMTLHTRK